MAADVLELAAWSPSVHFLRWLLTSCPPIIHVVNVTSGHCHLFITQSSSFIANYFKRFLSMLSGSILANIIASWWPTMKRSQQMPDSTQKPLSILITCLSQSAIWIGYLQQLARSYSSFLMILWLKNFLRTVFSFNLFNWVHNPRQATTNILIACRRMGLTRDLNIEPGHVYWFVKTDIFQQVNLAIQPAGLKDDCVFLSWVLHLPHGMAGCSNAG